MLIRLFFLLSFIYSGTNQNFEIHFLGMPAAKVNLTVEDSIFNNQPAQSISFSTKAINFTQYIFNIDNCYHTVTSDEIKNILSFSKETYQPNVSNKIQTSIINGKTIYNDSTIEILPQTFNIFSLLYFISKNKLLNPNTFDLEREGLYYKAEITPLNLDSPDIIRYEIDLIKNQNYPQQKLIEHTDIFTWALFKEKSKNHITVDYKKNQIINCTFDTGLIKMTAKNIDYIEK